MGDKSPKSKDKAKKQHAVQKEKKSSANTEAMEAKRKDAPK